MGDPGLLQKFPYFPALLSEGGGSREQSAAADRAATGIPGTGRGQDEQEVELVEQIHQDNHLVDNRESTVR